MKFFDFFAGIGGFRLGMEMAGHECVGHCEIDKFANQSYNAMHRPKESEAFFEDVRTIRVEDLPEADVYCFGFPCQSFSIAGKRGGFGDTRGTLFFEIMRLAAVRHPSILFAENVRGLLSHDNGRTFGTIIRTMGELGYSVEWCVLNSKNFGVPQNRERVFIIGHLGNECRFPVFPFGEYDELASFVEGRKRIIAPTLTTRTGESDTVGIYPKEKGGFLLVTGYHKGNKPLKLDEKIRKLTPRECFRLQGFPDEYFERAAAVCSDSQLYKQAGNSVTVPVIYEIAKRLKI